MQPFQQVWQKMSPKSSFWQQRLRRSTDFKPALSCHVKNSAVESVQNSGEFYLLGPNFVAVLCAACVMWQGSGECCVSAACGISDVSCSNTLGCTSDIESVFQLTHEVDEANEILALAS